MHPAQIAILYKLRHSQSASFSVLMHETNLESDVFKFHIQKLVKLGHIYKLTDGNYTLTPSGKEFANNLSEEKRVTQKQPKLSVLLVVPNPNQPGQYLMQRRMRHPYYGFWGCISGPVQWGEDAEETAIRELEKQTGLQASFNVQSFYRKRDYDKENELLEDKLFIILKASNIEGDLGDSSWSHGINRWMSLDELWNEERYFSSSSDAINMTLQATLYTSQKATYRTSDY